MLQEKPSRKPRSASQPGEDTLSTEAASDQPTPDEMEGAPNATPEHPPAGSENAQQDTLDRMVEQLRSSGVDAVFGKPQQVGGRTLIPVASVTYGLGFGRGRGRQRSSEQGEGEGMGGGGMVRVKPLAVVVVDDSMVRVRPVIDVNRLAFFAIALFGSAAMLRALRGRR